MKQSICVQLKNEAKHLCTASPMCFASFFLCFASFFLAFVYSYKCVALLQQMCWFASHATQHIAKQSSTSKATHCKNTQMCCFASFFCFIFCFASFFCFIFFGTLCFVFFWDAWLHFFFFLGRFASFFLGRVPTFFI